MPPHKTIHHCNSLEATARKICETCGGRWSGGKGMARCPAHDDRTPSLGVALGRRAILFHCFAGCSRTGVLEALARDGIRSGTLFATSRGNTSTCSSETAKPALGAFRIWRPAESLKDSPAKAYLKARGITAGFSALRFHGATPLGSKGRARFLPALIAAVSLEDGPIAIHRTFLHSLEPRVAAFARAFLRFINM